MTDAVLLASALLAGAALASPFAYIAGRRSSREELAGAVDLIEAMNAAPDREALALPPERPEPEEDPAPPEWQHDGERAITEPCASCGGVGNVRLGVGAVLCKTCADATTCGYCGEVPQGFATIGGTRYCHGDWQEPSCYELASSAAVEPRSPYIQALDATWSAASHLQAPDPQDDTGTGTIAHLHSGEWAPAAPAPKQVGR